MRDAVQKLNEQIEAVVDTLQPGMQASRRFQLEAREEWGGLVDTSVEMMKPTVLIVLNNAAQMQKMLKSHSSYGSKKLFECDLMEELGNGEWHVRYVDDGKEEKRLKSQLRKLSGGKWIEGTARCKAEKSKELRDQDGLLKQLEHYSTKDERIRVVFIIDEADMSVGSPSRDSNKLARLHFHETSDEINARNIRRGVREHLFGSVSITATPLALYLCTFKPDCNTIKIVETTYNIWTATMNGDAFYSAIGYLGPREDDFTVDLAEEWANAAAVRKDIWEFMQANRKDIEGAGYQWKDCSEDHLGSSDPIADGPRRLGKSPTVAAIRTAATLCGRTIVVHCERVPDEDEPDSGDDDGDSQDEPQDSSYPVTYATWEFGRAAGSGSEQEPPIHLLKRSIPVDSDQYKDAPAVFDFFNALVERSEEESGGDGRRLTPHVVFIDRPDNYVAYENPAHPATNGRFIQRKELEPRFAQRTLKVDYYKQLWLEAEICDEEQWAGHVEEVLRDGVARDIGHGFTMRKRRLKGGGVNVYVRKPGVRATSKDAERILNTIQSMEESTKMAAGDGLNPDLLNISNMITCMVTSGDEFRHGLIITDKVKLTRQQTALQETLTHAHKDVALAIVTYNCREGIRIAFTEKLRQDHLGAKLLHDDVHQKVKNLGGSDSFITDDGMVVIKKKPM